jgi:hypothetical protein
MRIASTIVGRVHLKIPFSAIKATWPRSSYARANPLLFHKAGLKRVHDSQMTYFS